MESGANAGEAGRRAELLRLAGELGNISEACRRLGVDRSAYYRAVKGTRNAAGSAGKAMPRKPPELEEKLIALCLEFPEWGCDRLAYYLTLKGDPISSPTVQKILMRHGLGRRPQREAGRLLAARAASADS